MSQSQFNLGSESGGNESDNSADEPASTASDTNLIKKNAQMKAAPAVPRKPDRLDNSLLNRSTPTNRTGYQPLIREDSVRSHRNSVHG